MFMVYLSRGRLLTLLGVLKTPDGGRLPCVTWRDPDESDAEGWLLAETFECRLRGASMENRPFLIKGPKIGRHAAIMEAHGSMINQIRLLTTRAVREYHQYHEGCGSK